MWGKTNRERKHGSQNAKWQDERTGDKKGNYYDLANQDEKYAITSNVSLRTSVVSKRKTWF